MLCRMIINWKRTYLFVLFFFILSFKDVFVQGESNFVVVDDRASLSWNALVRTFNTSTQGVYWNDLPDLPNRKFAYLWTHSVIMQAALDNINDGKNSSFLDSLFALQSYKLEARGFTAYAPILHPSESQLRFYDDNSVIGLVLIRAAKILKDKKYQILKKIYNIWPFIESGMSKKGGEFWYEKNPKRLFAICSGGSSSELALRLLGYSSNETFLEFSEKSLEWIDSHLLNNSTSLYWNSYYLKISDVPSTCSTGTHICNWLFTYNQGYMINVLVLLYQHTGNRDYLEQAVLTAQASINFFKNEILWLQPPVFNAIYFRALLLLNKVLPDPKYLSMMNSYLNKVWDTVRDKKSGLFILNGIGQYGSSFGSIDQAAFVQMFSIIQKFD